MKVMEERDRRFANLEKKIGLFVVTAIVGLAVVVAFIGIQQEVFISKTEILFIADSGRDLIEGQPVKFKGFRIGKVRKVSLNDEAKVEVVLNIKESHMKWIKTDSLARLVQEGVIGDNIIEITGGSEGAPQVVEGGTISFEREQGINELFEDLKDEIELALKDIREILSYVNDPGGDIKTTLANLNRLSGELLETRKNIDGLIAGNINGTLDGIEALVASIRNEAMPQLASALNTVDSQLPGMVDSASRSLQNIEMITSDIRRVSPQVPRIVEEGGELIEGTREVVDSVKDMWPIRKGIKKPREKTLEVDSYE